MAEKESQESTAFEIKKQESFVEDYKVYQPNPMMMVYDNMTSIWQTRFLKAYQAKVQPSDPNTYMARFSLAEFLDAIDIKKKPTVEELKKYALSILGIQVDFAEYRRKYGDEKLPKYFMKLVNLFEYFEVTGEETDGIDGLYVEVRPTRPMEHLLKEIKKLGYVDYPVKYALNFSTNRTIRFYEFLKRNEGKNITVKIEELKKYLGIKQNSYPKANEFTRRVIKSGVKEINEQSDLNVKYRTISGRGKGGGTIGYRFEVKTKVVIPTPKIDKTVPEGQQLPGQVSMSDISEQVQEPTSAIPKHHLAIDAELLTLLPAEFNYSIVHADAVRAVVWEHLRNHPKMMATPASDWKGEIMKVVEQFMGAPWKTKLTKLKDPTKTVSYFIKCLTNWLIDECVAENNSSFDGDEFIDAALKRGFDD